MCALISTDKDWLVFPPTYTVGYSTEGFSGLLSIGSPLKSSVLPFPRISVADGIGELMAKYVQKWLPPPTVDDYMWEVQQDLWWGQKEQARRKIMWLMEKYLGDDNGEGTFREIEGGKSKENEREDGGVECH